MVAVLQGTVSWMPAQTPWLLHLFLCTRHWLSAGTDGDLVAQAVREKEIFQNWWSRTRNTKRKTQMQSKEAAYWATSLSASQNFLTFTLSMVLLTTFNSIITYPKVSIRASEHLWFYHCFLLKLPPIPFPQQVSRESELSLPGVSIV